MSASVLFDAPGPKARRRNLIFGIIGTLIIVAILAVAVLRLADKGQFDSFRWKPFTTASMWQDVLIPGVLGTLKAAALAIVISAVLGAVLAMIRMIEVPSGHGPINLALTALKWLATIWVELTRAIPVLLMMLFIFGVLSSNGMGSGNGPLIATVGGLVFYNSSVICEVIRSGVHQLPNGQREAGLALGLKPGQALRLILLPQAITAMMPSLISQVVVILKDTALGYNVLYGELLYKAKSASSINGNIFAILVVVAVIYIAINYSIGKFAEWVERRLASRGRTAGAPADPDDPAAPGAVAGTDLNPAPQK